MYIYNRFLIWENHLNHLHQSISSMDGSSSHGATAGTEAHILDCHVGPNHPFWLVVTLLDWNWISLNPSGWWFQPFWKIWKSVGIIIPNLWKSKSHVPNHQPAICKYCSNYRVTQNISKSTEQMDIYIYQLIYFHRYINQNISIDISTYFNWYIFNYRWFISIWTGQADPATHRKGNAGNRRI